MSEIRTFYSRQMNTPVALPAIDPTLMWVLAVTAAGGSVNSARQTLVNSLITSLQTDGIWNKLDRLWLFAMETEFQAKVDLVANATATPTLSPLFTVNRGYTGNGVNSYVDTNYNPSTMGHRYIQDSASVSAWCATSRGLQPFCITGATNALNRDADLFNHISSGGSGVFVRINSGGGTTLTNGNSQGLVTVNRSGGSSCEGYFNGSSLGTTVDVSNGVPTVSFWVGGNDLEGAMNGPSTDQCAAVAYGGSLTSTDASNLYTRLRTYMTAVGVP